MTSTINLADPVLTARDLDKYASGALMGAQMALEVINDAIFSIKHYHGDSQLLAGLYEAQRVVEAERAARYSEALIAMNEHTRVICEQTTQILVNLGR